MCLSASRTVSKGEAMSIRFDGFLTADVISQQLDLPDQVVATALAAIHPLTRRFPDDPDTVYFSPATTSEVEDWLIDHPQVLDAYLAFPYYQPDANQFDS
jgi:hypothetical protein